MPNNRVGDHDVNVLREYIQFFPENGLAISLKAFLDSEISPFPVALEGDKTVEKPVAPGDEQPDNNTVDAAAPDQLLDDMIVRLASKQYEGAKLIYIQDAVEKCPTSILCHRILGDYYLLLDEYENAVDTSRNGRKIVLAESHRTGLAFQK